LLAVSLKDRGKGRERRKAIFGVQVGEVVEPVVEEGPKVPV
jgi:hypothetical protein